MTTDTNDGANAMTPEQRAELRKKAEAATPVIPADMMEYAHGGGRLAILRDGERKLIADFYGEGADRDFYGACKPQVILALLDRIEELEGAITAARTEARKNRPNPDKIWAILDSAISARKALSGAKP